MFSYGVSQYVTAPQVTFVRTLSVLLLYAFVIRNSDGTRMKWNLRCSVYIHFIVAKCNILCYIKYLWFL